MDLTCFNPQTASGGFTLLFGIVAFALGMAWYRWLLSSKYAEKLAELERKAAELDDARRGR